MKPESGRRGFGQEFLMVLQMGLTLAVAVPLLLWYWHADATGGIPAHELVPRGIYKWGPWHFSDKRVIVEYWLAVLFYLPVLSALIGVIAAIVHYKRDSTGRVFGRWVAVTLAQFIVFLFCCGNLAWLIW